MRGTSSLPTGGNQLPEVKESTETELRHSIFTHLRRQISWFLRFPLLLVAAALHDADAPWYVRHLKCEVSWHEPRELHLFLLANRRAEPSRVFCKFYFAPGPLLEVRAEGPNRPDARRLEVRAEGPNCPGARLLEVRAEGPNRPGACRLEVTAKDLIFEERSGASPGRYLVPADVPCQEEIEWSNGWILRRL